MERTALEEWNKPPQGAPSSMQLTSGFLTFSTNTTTAVRQNLPGLSRVILQAVGRLSKYIDGDHG